MNNVSKETIKTIWLDSVSAIETEYFQAATLLADHIATSRLTGEPDVIYLAAFQCAIHKRNTMLSAVATMLLKDADHVVRTTEAYLQYDEGLITSTECVDKLVDNV